LIVLFVAAVYAGSGLTQDRLQQPGDSILVRVNGTPEVLTTISRVRVVAFLKGGASTEIAWQGTFGRITIPTYGLEATDAEKSTAKTAVKENVAHVWGVQTPQHKWISFEEIDHISIEHGSESPGATDGYRSELRLMWANKGWRISYNGKNSKFEEVAVELRSRPTGNR
jgi:hypothetical protein